MLKIYEQDEIPQLPKIDSISTITRIKEVVVGIPLHTRNLEHLKIAIESLDSQSVPINFIMIDDMSPIRFELLHYLEQRSWKNNAVLILRTERVGLLQNTKEVREIATKFWGRCIYYFLASDHDYWHPSFVEINLNTIKNSNYALVCAPTIRVKAEWKPDEEILISNQFQQIKKAMLSSPNWVIRLRGIFSELSAGNMIYGLENIEATIDLPYYERCLGPDRLYIIRILQNHPICELVGRPMWFRRQVSTFSGARQVKNMFIGDLKAPNSLFRRFPDVHHCMLLFANSTSKGYINVFFTFGIILRMFVFKLKKSRKSILRKLKILKSRILSLVVIL